MQTFFNATNALRRYNTVLKGFALFAVLAFLAIPQARGQALSGTYTICKSGCDYDSLTSAVRDLVNNGVSGPVTFNIAAGNYDEGEGVLIEDVPGVSGTNRITFAGAGKTATRIHGTGVPDDGVFCVRDMGFVTIKDMMIENTSTSTNKDALHLYYADSCVVENCYIKIAPGSSSTINAFYHYYCVGNVIRNNTIWGGYNTLYNYNSTSSNKGYHLIENNRITRGYRYLVYSYYGYDHVYRNNYLDSASSSIGYGFRSYYENGSKYYNNIVPGTNLTDGAFYIYEPNTASTSEAFEVYNNLCGPFITDDPTDNDYGVYLNVPTDQNLNFWFYNNTVHLEYEDGVNFYMGDNSEGGLTIKNNIFSRTKGGQLTDYYDVLSSDVIEFNNYYAGTASQDLIEYNGTDYATVADYQAAAANNGHGAGATNVKPPYKSKTDMHLDGTQPAPAGDYMGLLTDVDGDSRCTITPTMGADASDYVRNLLPQAAATFSGPDTVFVGSPAIFLNSNKGVGEKYEYSFDGQVITDSIHARLVAPATGTYTLKLYTITCGGRDSFSRSVVVINPSSAPDSRFIASANTISPGEIIEFTDLSRNGATTWNWSISPDSVLSGGGKIPSYVYINGTSASSQHPVVQFLLGGSYDVCLTTTNSVGTDQLCRNDYITVKSNINIGTVGETRAKTGFVYDDGGPNAEYANDDELKSLLINPCAQQVKLVFNYFDVECAYDFVRVYDGADNTGIPLFSCPDTRGFSGDVGSSCSDYCVPGPTDTLVALSGQMYIEFEPDGSVNEDGFEAQWFAVGSGPTAPTASFEVADTVCTNSVVNITNTSTGDAVTYLWDLDGDINTIESTGKEVVAGFPSQGQITLNLIVFNCTDIDTFSKTITVLDPPAPSVEFSVDNTNPTTDDVVFFTPSIRECVEDYRWEISHDNGPGDFEFVNGTGSTSAMPQVMFTDTGCYTVKLVAGNVTGSDSVTKTCIVNVKEPYCKPGVAKLNPDLGISRVKFNTIDNSSAQAEEAYTSYVATDVTTVEIDVTYTLTVERNSNSNAIAYSAWIDWNGDGDFDDAQELAGSVSNLGGTTWNTDVTIPAIAATGATVLRIGATLGGEPNSACGTNQFGEYEDYRLYVQPDLTRPVITLTGPDTVYVEQGYTYTEPGFKAEDNLDGDITADVDVVSTPTFNNLLPNQYVFTYDVEDAAGNEAITQTRVVIVTNDQTPPALRVELPDTVYVVLGDQTYTDPQILSADDLVDGDKSADVIMTGAVNVNVVDTFTLSYFVQDDSGNDTTVNRTIIVQDTTAPTIQLLGQDTVYHNIGTAYTDSGVAYSDNYYSAAQLEDYLVVSGAVDEDKAGTYIITYSLTDPSGNGPVSVQRVVIVSDIEAPVITLLGDSVLNLEVNTQFKDPGILISDNRDNITTWITAGTFYQQFPDGFASELGTYTIIYEVMDKAGNIATAMRTIVVEDTRAPEIELTGNQIINVCRWSVYEDAGYILSDNYWSEDSIEVVMEGDFLDSETDLPGLYSFRYKATDGSGNVAYSENRIVNVLDENDFRCVSGMADKDMENAVKVYPNPSTGLFNIILDVQGTEHLRVSVLDISGREVAVAGNNLPGQKTMTMDLSDQPSGVYILKVAGSDYSFTRRIILNK